MMKEDLIAPCGMNCRLCRAYGRERRPCPGCGGDDRVKTGVRITCRIRNCEKRVDGSPYCFQCDSFPCRTLNHLDKRYRTKYSMSMIENLEEIRDTGIGRFLRKEKERWTCPECFAIICVHEPACLSCGYKWR